MDDETCFVQGKMVMTAGVGPSSLSSAFIVLWQILKIQNSVFLGGCMFILP